MASVIGRSSWALPVSRRGNFGLRANVRERKLPADVFGDPGFVEEDELAELSEDNVVRVRVVVVVESVAAADVVEVRRDEAFDLA